MNAPTFTVFPVFDAHPLQRWPVCDRRDDEIAAILKPDEPAVKQVVDTGRQKQPIFAVQSFRVVRVTPRFAVARDQVNGVCDSGDAAPLLNLHNALFVQPLPTTGGR